MDDPTCPECGHTVDEHSGFLGGCYPPCECTISYFDFAPRGDVVPL